MKNTLLLSLCTLFVCTTSIAQTSNDELLSHIPANASSVYQVDLSQLINKDGWSSIINTLGGASNKPDDKKIAGLLADPASIGIDIHRSIFVAKVGEHTIAIIPMTDSAKFLKVLRSEGTDKSFIIRPGKIRSAHEGDEGYAWNDKLMVVTFNKKPKEGEKVPAPKKGAPGAHPQPLPAAWIGSVHESTAALAGYPTTPFLTNTWLKQGLADGASLHMWGRENVLGSLQKNLKHAAPMAGNMSGMFSGNKKESDKPEETLGSLFFENGRVLFNFHIRYSPEITQMIQAFKSTPLNEDLINRLPKGDLLGVASVHFDINNYFAILDKTGARKTLDSALAAKQLSMDDIQKAIKGDLLVAAIAAPAKPSADSTPVKPIVNFYFIVGLNDVDKFNKIADKLNLFKKDSDNTDSSGTPKKPIAHTLKDNILVLGKSQDLTDSYFAGPGRGHSDLVTSDLRDNPVAVAVDFKTLATFLSDPGMQTNMKAMQAAMFMSKLNTFNLSVGPTPEGNILLKIEIRMVDQSKNSLESLFELLNPGH